MSDQNQTDDNQKTQPDAEDSLYPQLSFSTFVISLNAGALVHMGAMEDPDTQVKQKNLPLAKQVIDTLNMLEEKTRGNLTDEEGRLLKSILYDLKIIYVRERG